ncbi:hypothetical protein ACFQ5D_23675 [Paenibacillus farraposensis]|uniref:Uncharacterized protein n=1 Tax=Paenibacillus farraposensis TaxID=2807095 RepID=A0ABW4DKH1_9BACL|nr:hypothetical protein [Paenibacillus farraposensis]MCC3381037.1 hypothetical protein [Paenibacillus farraposensis]
METRRRTYTRCKGLKYETKKDLAETAEVFAKYKTELEEINKAIAALK